MKISNKTLKLLQRIGQLEEVCQEFKAQRDTGLLNSKWYEAAYDLDVTRVVCQQSLEQDFKDSLKA